MHDGTRQGRGRRRALVAGGIALAGIGLAGVSTAIATAAWTDRTWFATGATTGSADLQGSIDGTVWRDSDAEGAIELVLPSIADLRPGDSTAYPIRIRNTGTLAADLTGSVAASGALFGGIDPVTAVLSDLPGTVAGGATVGATLTITAPEWTGFAHQGETGGVKVSIVGTTG